MLYIYLYMFISIPNRYAILYLSDIRYHVAFYSSRLPISCSYVIKTILIDSFYMYIFIVFIKNGNSDGQPRSGPAIFNDVTCKCAYVAI